MATQPLYQSYSPPAPPLVAVRNNEHAPLIRGSAAVAVQRAARELPAEVRDATLDEIAIAEQTAAVIKQARRSLSPEYMPVFLKWAAAASALSTKGEDDEENYRNLGVLLEALEVLGKARSRGMSDLVFRTYVLSLEATESSCFGPMRQPDNDDSTIIERLAYDAYLDIRNLDPLPEMLEELAEAAWEASDSSLSFASSIGKAITDTFSTALANDEWQSEATGYCSRPADDWASAKAAYLAADHLCNVMSVDDPQADLKVDACCAAMDYLIEQVRAPDLSALRLKLDLALGRAECFEDVLFDDHARGIIADIQHLVCQPMPHDPHAPWLAERNRAQAAINSADETLTDAAADALTTHMVERDQEIANTPATTWDGVLAKLALVAQISLEGFEPNLDWCASALVDAQCVTGIGSLVGAAEARHREMAA